jgi:predicted RNase H-like nuclease (RuvC/YqgF family)
VEVPVEVIKEVEKIVEVTVEKVVTKIEYISDKTSENELLLKIQQLESEKKIFSTKIEELESEIVVFSTKMTEMENIFHNNDNSQQLQNTIQTLMKNLRDKNIEIDELKKQLTEQQKNNEINERAKYLRSSNLDDNLYK